VCKGNALQLSTEPEPSCRDLSPRLLAASRLPTRAPPSQLSASAAALKAPCHDLRQCVKEKPRGSLKAHRAGAEPTSLEGGEANRAIYSRRCLLVKTRQPHASRDNAEGVGQGSVPVGHARWAPRPQACTVRDFLGQAGLMSYCTTYDYRSSRHISITSPAHTSHTSGVTCHIPHITKKLT
jgi:hypothetical protein